jgi:hypothetical protein
MRLDEMIRFLLLFIFLIFVMSLIIDMIKDSKVLIHVKRKSINKIEQETLKRIEKMNKKCQKK